MKLPVHDWQFWVVTVIALFCAWLVLRMIVPRHWWPWRGRGAGRATTLTVKGKTVKESSRTAKQQSSK